MSRSEITVVCATRNALDAVRLTFSSFDRHTPEPRRVLVADNGSTDGTLEYLERLDWVEVVGLDERRRRMEAQFERMHAAASSLAERLDRHAESLPDAERALVSSLRHQIAPDAAGIDAPSLPEHGGTLDWLITQVRTPLVLTLDSDVELLRTGWLSEIVERLETNRLAAIGPHERGRGGYKPRLAPYLLLLRTDVLRRLRVSFRGFARFGAEEELKRWAARPPSFTMEPRELDSYTTAEIYPTGAELFERLQAARLPWADLPESVASSVVHRGHMSWAAAADDYMLEVPSSLQAHHKAALGEVVDRLRHYA